MDVLTPIDGSDCSYRAVEHAAEFVQRYDGTLHVVHITTVEGNSAQEILDRASSILADEGITADSEIVSDLQATDPRYGNRIGKDILRLVEEREYDHIIMGHHGAGAVERLVLGSAAQTVIQAAEVPTTVIP